jgi:predicted nucleotidyltransferase
MTTEHGKDVKSGYHQFVLSGFQGAIQPENENGQGNKGEQKTAKTDASFWKKNEYILFIPFVVKQVSVSDSELRYKLQVNSNIDILVATRPKRGEVDVKQITYIPHTKTKRPVSVSLVSRISAVGMSPFSLADGLPIYESIAHVFSGTMDKINTALQRIIQQSEKAPSRIVDSGVSTESPPAPKSGRTDKKKRRSATLRAQVLPENPPENPSVVAEVDGKVLGDGYIDWKVPF